jgi:hypothetical protein
MTQYWQLDDAPLESDRYWRESEEYIREEEPPAAVLPGSAT